MGQRRQRMGKRLGGMAIGSEIIFILKHFQPRSENRNCFWRSGKRRTRPQSGMNRHAAVGLYDEQIERGAAMNGRDDIGFGDQRPPIVGEPCHRAIACFGGQQRFAEASGDPKCLGRFARRVEMN